MATSGAMEHVHRTLSEPTFGNDMLSVLNDMRAEGVLLDVTVVVGEEEFMAHSTVLAYGSDYFRGMKESQEKRVDLKDPSVTAAAFRLLLEFLYTGQLVMSLENVYEVLAVANHLQVQSALRLCGDFITQTLRESQFDMAKYSRGTQVADLYNLKTLQESLDTVIAEDFMEVTSSHDFLEYATKDEMIRLLQLETLAAPSEQQVYEAALRWLTHDTSHMEHAAAVLSHVRLALLDIGLLYGLLRTELGTIEECRNLILEAMAYHSLPTTETKDGWPRSKSRAQMDEQVLLALSLEARKFTTKTGWTKTAISLGGRTVYAVAVVGNVMYMIYKEYFMSYDPTTDELSNLIFPPDYHHGAPRMVAIGARLFLVCGKEGVRKSKAWCYDISVGRWSKIPPLPQYKSGVALASCQGAVLAIGGKVYSTTAEGKDTDVRTSRVQTFFPVKNSWEAVSPTIQPHFQATAMVQGDIIYVAGGDTVVNGRTCSNTSVEMCKVSVDDVFGVTVSPWSLIHQPLPTQKFASEVAVIDRKAYFILGGQMHFTGKFVDTHTSEEDVEDMCRAFLRNVQSTSDVVCATLSLNEKT
ncbi:kelch-like protein diablo [Branchiostoma floridae]|uniref:Kelch-like protein diablo n=1 Tax=Branchiostoma floridae TaxID=7739 RepID=A0A9J7LUL3_BRAFL|nr:kelch-like protein diablo [Branchiostoma floridae]